MGILRAAAPPLHHLRAAAADTIFGKKGPDDMFGARHDSLVGGGLGLLGR